MTDAQLDALILADLEKSGLSRRDMYCKPTLVDFKGNYAPGYDMQYPDPLTGKPNGFARRKFLTEPTGFRRVAGLKQKYDQPSTPPRAYHSRRWNWSEIRSNPEQPLVITEGEKKAEAACKEGFQTLGIGGVWNFKSRKEELIPDLEAVAWTNRRVHLVYDSDGVQNWQVQRAADELAAQLVKRGAHVYVLFLPQLKKDQKTGLDDFLVAKGKAAFAKVLESAVEWQSSRRVLRSEPLHCAVEKSERILAFNLAHRLFRRGSDLVRVTLEQDKRQQDAIFRPQGNAHLVPVNETDIEFILSQQGCCYAVKNVGGRNEIKPASPKREWCRHVIERVRAFPEVVPWSPLQMISSAPILLADGTVIDQPGYHADTGIWLNTDGQDFPRLLPRPTRKQARAAIEMYERVFGRFPFANADSYAAVLATVISVLIRHLLPTVPLLGITAPEAGSGKTKIAESISGATTGRLPSRMSYDETKEFDKHFPVPLLAGDPIILIDNVVNKFVNSVRLSIVLTTAGACRFRVLGETNEHVIVNKSVVIVTGNQLAFAGDVPRRSLLTKLLPNTARPEERSFDFDPVQRAREMYPELVTAALTTVRYYLQAGCPVPKYADNAPQESGSFEEWNRIVRGLLVHLDIGDPLATQREARAENPMLQDEIALVRALANLFPNCKEFSAANVKTAIGSDAFSMLVGQDGRWDAQQVGFRLRGLRDRVLEGLQLEGVGHLHGTARYRVKKAGGVGLAKSRPKQNSGVHKNTVSTKLTNPTPPAHKPAGARR